MPNISHTKVFLHLCLLCSLAVAQPLYDLAGTTPEFLVAHRLEPIHIIAFVVILSLCVPLLFFLVYRVTHAFSFKSGRFMLGIFVILLVSLTLMPIVSKWLALDDVLAVVLAVFAAAVFARFYFKNEGARLFLSWFSLAALIFPLNFLFVSPASELLEIGDDSRAYRSLALKWTPPIVVVVFDEFPLLSLLNSGLEIDRGRFPNFAALTETTTWYRYHTTNSDSTLVSIPSLLSGNMPMGRDRGLPSHKVYQNNLLALLQDQYSVSATEHGTRLCPDTVCDPKPAYFKLLFTDSLVILGQIWAPADLARHLPSTNNDWLGFMGEEVSVAQVFDTPRDFQKTIDWRARVYQYDQFIEGITSASGQLYYFHSMFPHGSWRHLPDGRLLTASPGGQIMGISPNDPDSIYKHVWYDSDAAARVSRQRHVLQVGFVDRMIGELVSRLKSLGIYDESLVIITSDHGVSFNAGYSRRNIHGGNLAEIAAVPLFIKYPGNQPNGVSDQNAQSMDILPTLLDVLDARGWDEYDGQSLLDSDRNEQIEKVLYSEKRRFAKIDFSAYKHELQKAAQKLSSEYGQQDYASLYRAGDQLGLVGTRVSDYPLSSRTVPGVVYQYPDFLRSAHFDGSFTQCVVHGNFDSEFSDNPSQILAVSVDGIIRAVTQPFGFPGQENGFQTLVPPGSFGPDNADVRSWFILQSDQGITLAEAKGEESRSYGLIGDIRSGWAIRKDDQEVPVERGEVPGWVTVIPEQTPNTFLVGGWAADLAAQQPAAWILVFINGAYYYALKPNRDTEKTATNYQMRGILRSGFRFPVSVNVGGDPTGMEVRIFALSRAGEISELNYPKDSERWVFKPNPRPIGPAIKPYD